MRNLYESAETILFLNGFQAPSFRKRSGVHQGDPLNGCLYTLVMEPLAWALQKHPELTGFSIGEIQKVLTALIYADDTLILLTTQREADIV